MNSELRERILAYNRSVQQEEKTDINEIFDGKGNKINLATGGGVPSGGKTGQLLYKNTDEDYDVKWEDLIIPEQYGLITYDQDRTITIT